MARVQDLAYSAEEEEDTSQAGSSRWNATVRILAQVRQSILNVFSGRS